jgi:Cys-rich protein (TIGR01571 family)
LKLTWQVAQPRNPAQSESAFTVLLAISIIHVIMFVMYLMLIPFIVMNDMSKPINTNDTFSSFSTNDDSVHGSADNSELSFLVVVFSLIHMFLGYGWPIMVAVWIFQARLVVRKMYAIPGDNCTDCLCSSFLPCCTIGQILRHTTDYDKYEGNLCTSDGLRPNSTLSTATGFRDAKYDDLSLV